MDKLLKKIIRICRSISQGKYEYVKQLEELTIQGKHPDDIVQLSESFSMMLVKLEAREYELEKALSMLKEKNAHLTDRIHTLKIDIDKIKKNAAVAQITSSKIFKKIQKKKKGMKK